jgi:translation initiation factor IF-3
LWLGALVVDLSHSCQSKKKDKKIIKIRVMSKKLSSFHVEKHDTMQTVAQMRNFLKQNNRIRKLLGKLAHELEFSF